ncbi:MAG: hypothetical protein ACK4YV_05000 [Emticicia sp.]
MEIYIDKAFLDNFYAKYDAKNDTHRNLRKFLSKANFGKVFLDFEYSSKEEFIEALNKNSFLDELINVKSVMPDSSFKTHCTNSSFYEEGSASKYFFVDDLNIQQLEDNFGCIAINSQNLEKASFLFCLFLFPISKKQGNPSNWNFVTDFKHPFNAMVLTDNYLFDYNNQEMNENLVAFLKKILPDKLSIPFHLTIIGKDTKKNIDISQKKIEIEKALQLSFNYEINVTIIPEAIHDRNIFTNFLWINSGIGLSIFKVESRNLKLKNTSNFTFLPISYINQDFKPYFSSMKAVSSNAVLSTRNELLENCKHKNRIETASVGNKINRLL